jgi:ATP-independent RNA helicase DbpA
VQALILCPTRELADQVTQEVRRLARALPNTKLVTLCGGKPIGPQRVSLKHGVHIVIGTPGRILDHLEKRSLNLDRMKVLVLDEADRMLDMGFEEAVSAIVKKASTRKQTLLFSATFPPEIQTMSSSIQRNPRHIVAEAEASSGTIEQLFYEVKKNNRDDTLLALFEHYRLTSALVFCHTKVDCDRVATFLNDHAIQARAIHGDLAQKDRDRVLAMFANSSTPVLVATDVAARGLDIKALPVVINYELPRSPEIYVHRIGRTGRAGESGMALSLAVEAEHKRIDAIEAFTGEPCLRDVPASLDRVSNYRLIAPVQTLQIDAGRKHKLRPTDILGALTGDGGLPGTAIGKIDIFDMHTLVAINRDTASKALAYMKTGRIKGRNVKARLLN